METVIKMKRLNVNLPAPVYEELQQLSQGSGRSMTDVIRIAFGLVKVAIDETNAGNKLFVGTADGKLLKELVLPR